MATIGIELFVIMAVTFLSSAAIGCKDRYVWIADGSYSCKGLLDPADTVGLYPKRDYFCNTYKLTYCCQTCKIVNEELKKEELQKNEFQKQELQKKELNKQQMQMKTMKKPLVTKTQLPNVIAPFNSYLISRPENIFQRWINTLYQYLQPLSKSNNLQNQV
ncbi:hypothetical protein ACJMK2_040373 [Sinanodonta woodiana]|uniref:Secreted protein n=1 Tax=Sinanodonta woodiana TaxID=1069815 RepID=A0ABD3WET9_SINWO